MTHGWMQLRSMRAYRRLALERVATVHATVGLNRRCATSRRTTACIVRVRATPQPHRPTSGAECVRMLRMSACSECPHPAASLFLRAPREPCRPVRVLKYNLTRSTNHRPLIRHVHNLRIFRNKKSLQNLTPLLTPPQFTCTACFPHSLYLRHCTPSELQRSGGFF